MIWLILLALFVALLVTLRCLIAALKHDFEAASLIFEE
jgi:hypothetical protein